MFRTLRRQDRALSQEETMEILRRGKFGVLSIVGEDGYPYGVPLHYVVIDHAIYFHCSRVQGHKDDALAKNSKISFTVIETEDAIQCKAPFFLAQRNRFPVWKKSCWNIWWKNLFQIPNGTKPRRGLLLPKKM